MGIDEDNEGGDGETEAEVNDDAEDSTEYEHWGGFAYPMKVTDVIPMGELLQMLKRYSEAYQADEIEGREWRQRRDKRRG